MIDTKIQKSAITLPASSALPLSFRANRPNYIFETGFFCKNAGLFNWPNLRVKPMTDDTSTLYAKLLGETATIEWKALERFWAKGDLIWVDPGLDLIEVATAMAENRSEIVAKWRSAGTVGPVTAEQALDLQSRDPEIWAVVVSPFIVIQVKQ
jgi:hypothetical protein